MVALVHFYPGVFNFFSHPVSLLRWWTVLGLMSDQALQIMNDMSQSDLRGSQPGGVVCLAWPEVSVRCLTLNSGLVQSEL